MKRVEGTGRREGKIKAGGTIEQVWTMEKAWPSNDREKERVSFVFRRETVRVILYLSAPGLLFLPSLFFIDRARSRFFSHSAIFSAIFLANYSTRFPPRNLFSPLSTFHPHFPVFSSLLSFSFSFSLQAKMHRYRREAWCFP